MILKLQDKIFSFATVTLLSALTLGGIAAWYSIQGLIAIFSAAVIPIMIMGGALEAAKVVTTVWLHRYWKRASWFMKSYMITAVCLLAFITSMGIFGALSKSHSDQALVSGDVTAAIAVYDQKIDAAKQNIDTDRKALSQMDAQVDQLLGRSTDTIGASRAVTIRKQQATERTSLNKDIETNQVLLSQLSDESIPIRAKGRKVEADVGPIKYIAALIYGDHPSNDLLERAVRWVIIIIVFVFDPLALTLVLGAQSSYEWLEEDRANKVKDTNETLVSDVETNFGPFGPTTNFFEPIIDLPLVPSGDEYIPWTPPIGSPPRKYNEEKLLTIEEEETPQNVLQSNDVGYDEPDGDELPEEHITYATKVSNQLEPDEISLSESDFYDAEEVHGPTETIIVGHDVSPLLEKEEESSSSEHKWFTASRLAVTPDHEIISTGFGTKFPINPNGGDLFVRIDQIPNKVFKFDNTQWIVINKDQTNSYLYDNNYLNYLIDRIDSGEYDLDLLSENEKIEIEHYLLKNIKA